MNPRKETLKQLLFFIGLSSVVLTGILIFSGYFFLVGGLVLYFGEQPRGLFPEETYWLIVKIFLSGVLIVSFSVLFKIIKNDFKKFHTANLQKNLAALGYSSAVASATSLLLYGFSANFGLVLSVSILFVSAIILAFSILYSYIFTIKQYQDLINNLD